MSDEGKPKFDRKLSDEQIQKFTDLGEILDRDTQDPTNLSELLRKKSALDIVVSGVTGSPKIALIQQLIGKMTDRRVLRDWWHSILRDYGKYSCYAFFLVLPGDIEALRYLTDFGDELHILSGDSCLVIVVTDLAVSSSGMSQVFDSGLWRSGIKSHVSSGASITIARHLKIPVAKKLPCMVVFQDIRNPVHIVIPLRDLTTKEITQNMRKMFLELQEGLEQGKPPLDVIRGHLRRERLGKTGKTVVHKVRKIADKTFETAIKALVEAEVKGGIP